MGKVIQLHERPTLAEYQAIVTEMYDTDPSIYLLLAAFREDEQYDITYVYYADSQEDFINILGQIIKEARLEQGE